MTASTVPGSDSTRHLHPARNLVDAIRRIGCDDLPQSVIHPRSGH